MWKIKVYEKFYKGESLQGYINKIEMGFEAFLILQAKTESEKDRYKNEAFNNTKRITITD